MSKTQANDITLADVNKEAFCAWLEENGYKILAVRSAHEFVRYRKHSGKDTTINVTRAGVLNIAGSQRALVQAFLTGESDLKLPASSKDKLRMRLIERDGARCAYCGRQLSMEEATIEHVVPKSAGGPSNLHNYLLACAECNRAVANYTIGQKVDVLLRRSEPTVVENLEGADLLGFAVAAFGLVLGAVVLLDHAALIFGAI